MNKKIEFHKVYFGAELDEAVRIFINDKGSDIVLFKKNMSVESWDELMKIVK